MHAAHTHKDTHTRARTFRARQRDAGAGRYAVPDARLDLGRQLAGCPAGEAEEQLEVGGAREAAADKRGGGGKASVIQALLHREKRARGQGSGGLAPLGEGFP